MDKKILQELAEKVGMAKTAGDVIQPMYVSSSSQLQAFAAAIIAEVKQSASEVLVRAIKKAVEYERAECAKIADWADAKEVSRNIRTRGDENATSIQ